MDTLEKTVGEWVAEDYRTAQVFKSHKIDFCCKGNRSIQEVVETNKLDLDQLINELNTAKERTIDDSIDFKNWSLDLLVDYIEKTHHRYVEAQIPVLMQFLLKLKSVHGENHPELIEVYDLFKASSEQLAMHMKKEELVLFPWVKKMVEADLSKSELGAPAFGTVKNPIQAMMQEHDNEGGRFREIASLTNDYTPPSDACNTYKVSFSLLKDFEEDLHRHIHLENNILFPKAEMLEKMF